MRRRIMIEDGQAALAAWLAGEATAAQTRTAVRYCLEELATRSPGNSVEVRVPPAGVVQVIAGPRHTRGTPPNEVQMPAQAWLELCTGRLTWEQGLATGVISASGIRADLSAVMPLWENSATV